ncbi:hypothetical protein FHS29_001284 [Saccharothrix tamanrassetensis]|uniref:DUF5667 domain-containing protein n=1 Tax=Saccharothrix tamanrassetensis TaxID=1051531 RepID=A0A841CEC3_9PSEU|nr:DUF5667 domain-containing protein [Saccharothrix tamanrassetensis]MBB5954714.1 hypothetical protein [Saccharothrix tamanrassetensis]
MGRGITPLWRHRQREQFARAVDALPEDTDPAFADELAVVTLLREAAATSGPDEATRARMRERVLGASPSPPTKVDRRRPRSGAHGRLAVALAAALCLVFSLAGMSLLLSRDALPGDALYGVKRTAESASLGLTFGEESKGYKRLEFAAARVSEMETMVDRYRDSGGGPLGGYLTALADFDADAAAGSRVLAAFGSGSDRRVLGSLRDWATSHAARLGDLRGRLPADAATRAGVSADLLGRIAQRATDLGAREHCGTVTSGQFDEIGPVPATDDCVVAPPAAPTASATEPPSAPVPTATPPAAAPTTTAPAPAPPTGGGTTPGTANPTPTLPLPSVTVTVTPPVQLPTLSLPSLPLPGLTG